VSSDDRLHPWSEFAAAAPALAEFGEHRINAGPPSHLATVRGERLPRVHPVGASVHGGHLALWMHPTSPKGRDIDADGRYALHCSVADNQGGEGEFWVRGFGCRVVTDEHRTARGRRVIGLLVIARLILVAAGRERRQDCESESGDHRRSHHSPWSALITTIDGEWARIAVPSTVPTRSPRSRYRSPRTRRR
jgi:hypothetical protein